MDGRGGASCAAETELWAVVGGQGVRLEAREGVEEAVGKLPEGVYTAFRSFDHERFVALEEHLERTQRSMEMLGWGVELDRAGVRRALDRAAREFPGDDAKVRVHVVREELEWLGERARVFLLLTPLLRVPEAFLREGVKVDIAPELHRARPRIKTTDFLRIRAPRPLERQDCYEHVMLDPEGRILEGSSSNFYGVRRATILTAGEGVLEGITRAVVVGIAKWSGLEVRFEGVRVQELGSLDEAFLSSSTRGVVPVVGVAGVRIGEGRPGAGTRRLIAGYQEYVVREARPAVG